MTHRAYSAREEFLNAATHGGATPSPALVKQIHETVYGEMADIEADAPLDEANVERFVRLIKEFSSMTQFIVITHNKRTMEAADTLYGVTMEELGVSKLISVDLKRAEDRATRQEEVGV